MSIQKLINDYIATHESGKSRLAVAAKKSERMIERYSTGESVPSPHTFYLIARKCGVDSMAALKMASEEQCRSHNK